uniref:Uncharacterized protein n=1 Tax=Siphoviridae sp. ctqwO1 TaxID=2826472 RepID=A0A8S5QN42_9CAUD|nr:MAG TPA: hypothetical protein [Siphoviridae sp. ctqwO1]
MKRHGFLQKKCWFQNRSSESAFAETSKRNVFT